MDLNDPINYKYEGISVTYQTEGTSWCTYDETIIFTKTWSGMYDIKDNNCQHFARDLTNYLTTANCGSTSRSTDLEDYANDLVEGCTDCCEPASDASTTTTAVWMMMMIISLPSLLT